MKQELIPQYTMPQLSKWSSLHNKESSDFNLSTIEPGILLQDFPYRASFYGIGLCKEGSVDLDVNLNSYHLRPNSLIIMGPDVIRKWRNQSADYHTKALFFTEDFFIEENINVATLRHFNFFNANALKIIQLETDEAIVIWKVLQEVKRILDSSSKRKKQIVRSYIYILLNLTADCFEKHTYLSTVVPRYTSDLIDRFKDLVCARYLDLRLVKEYANLLNITPKHLSETIKSETNKTAGEWIDEMVLMEAKVRLRQISRSIAQIAASMNFSDGSAFSKFFKRHTGIAPADYRKHL